MEKKDATDSEQTEPVVYSPKRCERESDGILADTWRRWAKRGVINSVKFGRLVRIPKSEFQRVMREGVEI